MSQPTAGPVKLAPGLDGSGTGLTDPRDLGPDNPNEPTPPPGTNPPGRTAACRCDPLERVRGSGISIEVSRSEY